VFSLISFFQPLSAFLFLLDEICSPVKGKISYNSCTV
jgi:hypothetical protein